MAIGSLRRRRTVFCPYCLADQDLKALGYQCAGRPASGRPSCVPYPDPQRQDVLEDASAVMPPVLRRAPDGRHIIDDLGMPLLRRGPIGKPVDCDRCGGATAISICTNCHSLLPEEMTGGGVSIGVVGAQLSGKTVWLTILEQQMLTRLPGRFHAAIDHPGGTVGLAEQLVANRNRMEDHGTLPAQTKSTGMQKKAPSVYKWKYADGGARVISVYDTAGEDVQNLQTASNQQHLRSSNAIVLVLDPFIFPENRRLAKTKGIEQLGPENAHADLVDALVTVLRQSEQGRGVSGKQGRISTPLAVVVTKMDAFWQDLDEHSPLRSHGQDVPYFDDVDSQTIHDHLLSLVSQWGGSGLINKLQTEFAEFRLFAVSALGNEPVYSHARLASGPSPSRVSDPLLWVLQREGFLPKPPKQSEL